MGNTQTRENPKNEEGMSATSDNIINRRNGTEKPVEAGEARNDENEFQIV